MSLGAPFRSPDSIFAPLVAKYEPEYEYPSGDDYRLAVGYAVIRSGERVEEGTGGSWCASDREEASYFSFKFGTAAPGGELSYGNESYPVRVTTNDSVTARMQSQILFLQKVDDDCVLAVHCHEHNLDGVKSKIREIITERNRAMRKHY